MRILPKDYAGLHPAFPDRPDPDFTLSGFAYSIGLASQFGVAPLLLSFILPTTYKFRVRSFALQVAAYGSIGVLGLTAINDSFIARPFLRSQGVSLPERRYIDRVGHLDYDDVGIIGGLCGSIIATATRTPGLVGGWKRGLGAFVFAGSVASSGYHSYKVNTMKDVEDFRRRSDAADASQKQWQPIVARTWTSSQGSSKGSLSAPAGSNAAAGPGHLPQVQPPELIAEGPHLAQKVPDMPEPILIPNTNYKWTSTNQIVDLETHLKRLQERRAHLALEAEIMWSWLSDKEAEYYNSSISKLDDKSPEKIHKLRYLETLGSTHARIWEQATRCDWMIADSQKRIAQLKSTHDSGNVTWRAACSAEASKADLRHSLDMLRMQERAMEQGKANMLQMKTQLAMSLIGDIDPEAGDQQVYDPVQKKMITQREILANIQKKLEEGMKEADVQSRASKEILDDAEKMRSQK